MDRTSEFFATASLLKSHGGVAPTPLAQFASSLGAPAGGAACALAPPAGAIARSAKRAARLVERLHALALVQGQYNDPGTELAELSTAAPEQGTIRSYRECIRCMGIGKEQRGRATTKKKKRHQFFPTATAAAPLVAAISFCLNPCRLTSSLLSSSNPKKNTNRVRLRR